MKKIRNKDWDKVVKRLCRTHGLTLEQGSKGIKLFKDGRLVGSAHITVSDSRHAIHNFEHEVEGRL